MFKTILKFGFAGAILIWLIKKGDLDFSLISQAITLHPLRVTLCIFLILFSAIGTSFRWKLLLEVKSQGKLPGKKIIGLTWIGLLFSSVLPGAVTGDVLKVVYAKDLDATLTKTFLITSALMDRIIGLLGLLFLLGFFSIWHYSELIALSIDMKKLLHFNFFLLMG
ncbi:MAG: lysylphosphatidylglycerol synthase domain-containing protein, partial [Bacteriovoracales bacterium]